MCNRNKRLIQSLKSFLGEDGLAEFKTVSLDFRSGAVSADEYYSYFISLFGNDTPAIFPDLVALLPDEGKRKALREVHRRHHTQVWLQLEPVFLVGNAFFVGL